MILQTAIVISLLALGCSLGHQARQESLQAAASTHHGGGSSPRKLALLVGINKYKHANPEKGFHNLAGCVNDVEKMRTLLVHGYGFHADEIMTLINEQATHSAITNRIHSFLAAQAHPGDVVVFHFSGHGSLASDFSMINQLEETIVPYDSRDPEGKVDDITGKELSFSITELSSKTKFVTVILDSCHSGDLLGRDVRSPRMAQIRWIPPDTRKLGENRSSVAAARVPFRSPNSRYAFIAAARSDETAKEYPVNGETYGALTYFLTQEVNLPGENRTYRDVMTPVRAAVTAVFPDQHPMLEGANLDDVLFSDSTKHSEPFIEVTPGERGAVKFSAGAVHGVTMESTYAIYAPETKTFSVTNPVIASARVVEVQSFESVASLSNAEVIPAFSRAVERIHHYPDQKLRIFHQPTTGSPLLQAVFSQLAVEPNVELSGEAAGCMLRIAEENDSVVIYAADSRKQLSALPRVTCTAEQVVRDVLTWVKWYNLLAIENAQPSVQLKVDILPDATFHGSHEDDVIFRPNMKFRLRFENQSSQDLFISILDLSDSGKVEPIYQANSRALPPGQQHTTYEFMASLPQGRKSGVDILKVFATDRPVDLGFLRQAPTQGTQKGPRPRGSESGLGQLLAQAGLGYSREVKAVPSDWVTLKCVITTKAEAEVK
jgi:uncharacterized caspase-like protein